MMRILWKDIQSMLRRPLVFILLFIGLVVGGFSLLVYYVSSSRELKLNRAAYGVETVVEARSAMNDPLGDRKTSCHSAGERFSRSLLCVGYVLWQCGV